MPRSRDRAADLRAIINRLRELRHTVATRRTPSNVCELPDGSQFRTWCEEGSINGLDLFFAGTPEPGPLVYFSVSFNGRRVMTGHLDAPPRVKSIKGKWVRIPNTPIPDVRVMSWKRGDWEARLFGEAAH